MKHPAGFIFILVIFSFIGHCFYDPSGEEEISEKESFNKALQVIPQKKILKEEPKEEVPLSLKETFELCSKYTFIECFDKSSLQDYEDYKSDLGPEAVSFIELKKDGTTRGQCVPKTFCLIIRD